MKYYVYGFAAVLAGFALGNAIASETAKDILFKEATLYDAASQLHTSAKIDFLFANRTNEKRSFQLPSGSNAALSKGLAKEYGRYPLSMGQVMLLVDAIPEASSPDGRVESLKNWLKNQVESSTYAERDGRIDGMSSLSQMVPREARRLAGFLSPGETLFSSLPPARQQEFLTFFRLSPLSTAAQALQQLIEVQDGWTKVGPAVEIKHPN